MITQEPTDTFDLPDDCEHDRVVIYENEARYEPPYRAIPFDYVGDDDQRNGYFEEPEDYAVTEAYRDAVGERAPVDIEKVRLRQPPTVDPEHSEPL